MPGMRLYVEPMDALVVDVGPDGRVKFEHEDWAEPTLQERRAILYAARREVDDLLDLIERLDGASSSST
jgi:hypothetical protein